MGLFSFFNNKENENAKSNEELNSLSNEHSFNDNDLGPTEDQFIDDADPKQIISEKNHSYTLNDILNFASIDFESRGYTDAMTNPDSSYKNENIELLLMDLSILIDRAKNFYNHTMEVIDFHIESRQDAGLIDLVKELESKKKKVIENLNEVLRLEQEDNDSGLGKRIRLSYNRGFNKGLASMSKELLQENTI